MNRIFTFIAATFIYFVSMSMLNAQCSELFFSEYVEGNYNNKALEIYNPNGDSVDLSQYRVVRFSNGSIDQKAQETINLPDRKIGPNGTFVITVDIRQPGTGADTPVFPALQAKTDAFLCPSCNPNTSPSRALCFNGDDALGLQKNDGGTWKNVDIFGKIGERPTNSWTDQFPYNNNIGAYWTRDQTLVRKSSVKQGVTANPAFFNPTTEWDSLPRNTFDSLGGHRCDCNKFPASVLNIHTLDLDIFPNPSALNAELKVNSKTIIKSYSIVNIIGKKVAEVEVNKSSFKISTDQMAKGVYLITFNAVNGEKVTKKVIVK
jgi:hypothetical protein